MFREKKILSIVIPAYNEEDCIFESAKRLLNLPSHLKDPLDLEIIFVDDGSHDNTLSILKEIALKNSCVKIISFSRNFGHQIAITAGIDLAKGDFVAIIDADLQDPPELIIDMYRIALTGFDVVYGKRRHREGETFFKKFMATTFYRLLEYMCDVKIPIDTGDFRLISRRVVDALQQMREHHRFIRGMIPWIGYKSTFIEYDRKKRFSGNTKYPLNKMLRFAADAIFSFSRKPLILAIRLGLTSVAIGIVGAIYMLYLKLILNTPIPGVTAIIISIVIFGGIQILLIGVIGEYISRIFEEGKGRPLYIISEIVN